MGNKKKLINKGLCDLFPKDINTFVDLFAGSSIVAMNASAQRYIVNDSDTNLIALYSIFKGYSSKEIIEHIESRIDEYGLARERTKRNEFKDKGKIEQYKSAYMNFRTFYNENKNILDFYTLMFYSFSQQFRFNSKGEFNMPCGNDYFSELNKTYIKNGCDFYNRENVKIGNKDFREFNFTSLTDKDFVYLDPPYLNTTATYNENGGWNSDDQNDLYKLCDWLTENNIKWAMSNVFSNKGVINQKLIDWSAKYNVFTFDKFTYMACGKGNSEATEVLITNY